MEPAMTDLALRQLQSHWPGYFKGMAARELPHELDVAAVARAAEVVSGICADSGPTGTQFRH